MHVETKVESHTYEDWKSHLTVLVDGEEVFSASDGEPEDNTLARNFNDCYKVETLIRKAYARGQNDLISKIIPFFQQVNKSQFIDEVGHHLQMNKPLLDLRDYVLTAMHQKPEMKGWYGNSSEVPKELYEAMSACLNLGPCILDSRTADQQTKDPNTVFIQNGVIHYKEID